MNGQEPKIVVDSNQDSPVKILTPSWVGHWLACSAHPLFLKYKAAQPTHSTRFFHGQSWGYKWGNHTSFSIPPTKTLKELERLWILSFSSWRTHLLFYNVLKSTGTPPPKKTKNKTKQNTTKFCHKIQIVMVLSH